MAKIRGFKPDLWTDDDFVEVSAFARLLWLGMWNFACDNGHLQDKSKQLKGRVLPMDDVNCAELLRELEGQGLIERAGGWITVPNLTHHQKPHKRWWVTCEKPGCVLPDGASYGYSKRESPVAQPLNNGETTVDNGCSTADVDGDGELMVSRSDIGGSDKPAATPPKANRKKPAKPLPDDWRPTEDHLTRCRENGIDPAVELAKFKAHAEANDRRQANWNAAFTQWLLNARPGNVRPLRPEADDQGRIVLPPLPPKGFFDQ